MPLDRTSAAASVRQPTSDATCAADSHAALDAAEPVSPSLCDIARITPLWDVLARVAPRAALTLPRACHDLRSSFAVQREKRERIAAASILADGYSPTERVESHGMDFDWQRLDTGGAPPKFNIGLATSLWKGGEHSHSADGTQALWNNRSDGLCVGRPGDTRRTLYPDGEPWRRSATWARRAFVFAEANGANSVQIWDAETQQRSTLWLGDRASVYCFAHDDRLLWLASGPGQDPASVREPSTAGLFDLRANRIVSTLGSSLPGSVTSLSSDADATHIALGKVETRRDAAGYALPVFANLMEKHVSTAYTIDARNRGVVGTMLYSPVHAPLLGAALKLSLTRDGAFLAVAYQENVDICRFDGQPVAHSPAEWLTNASTGPIGWSPDASRLAVVRRARVHTIATSVIARLRDPGTRCDDWLNDVADASSRGLAETKGALVR